MSLATVAMYKTKLKEKSYTNINKMLYFIFAIQVYATLHHWGVYISQVTSKFN